jgi:thiamine monophosphate synthase
MTGTIDQIGTDIDQIKAMDVEHIIFGHIFSPIGKDMKKMIQITKQLASLLNKKVRFPLEAIAIFEIKNYIISNDNSHVIMFTH